MTGLNTFSSKWPFIPPMLIAHHCPSPPAWLSSLFLIEGIYFYQAWWKSWVSILSGIIPIPLRGPEAIWYITSNLKQGCSNGFQRTMCLYDSIASGCFKFIRCCHEGIAGYFDFLLPVYHSLRCIESCSYRCAQEQLSKQTKSVFYSIDSMINHRYIATPCPRVEV